MGVMEVSRDGKLPGRGSAEILNAEDDGSAQKSASAAVCEPDAGLPGRAYWLLRLKVNTASSTVWAGPGRISICITACEAYCASMGFPPLTLDLRHVPFGRTVASSRTCPSKWPFFRDGGILRLVHDNTLRCSLRECSEPERCGAETGEEDKASRPGNQPASRLRSEVRAPRR